MFHTFSPETNPQILRFRSTQSEKTATSTTVATTATTTTATTLNEINFLRLMTIKKTPPQFEKRLNEQ